MNNVTKGFSRGFGGCLGILAALIMIPALTIAVFRIAGGTDGAVPSTDPKDICQTAVTEKLKDFPDALFVIATNPTYENSTRQMLSVSWLVTFSPDHLLAGHQQLEFTCHMKSTGEGWTIAKISGGPVNVIH